MQITVTDLFDGVTPETSPVTITVVEGTATTGGGGGVSDHGALTGLADDDHTQYHTDARGDARYWALSTDLATQAELDTHAADTTAVHGIADTSVLATDAEVATAVSDHAAAANPHPTYLTQAEGDAAYDALGAAAAAQSAAATDATTKVSNHAGAADPHTGYLKESDYDANTILAATTDNTPAALTVAASRVVGRKSSGDIAAMTAAETKTVLAIVAADVSDFSEAVDDRVDALVTDGSGIETTYDDSGGTLTVAKGAVTVNAQTGTSYTLVLADKAKFVTMSNASASTLTVPPNSSVAFPVGTLIDGAQLGAGQVTLTQGAGVTINATPGLKVAAQYGTFGLLKTATDVWLAFGRLSA